jgi:hypothetical protein
MDGLKVYEERARAIADKRESVAAQQAPSQESKKVSSEESGSTTDREGRKVNVEVVRKIVDKAN